MRWLSPVRPASSLFHRNRTAHFSTESENGQRSPAIDLFPGKSSGSYPAHRDWAEPRNYCFHRTRIYDVFFEKHEDFRTFFRKKIQKIFFPALKHSIYQDNGRPLSCIRLKNGKYGDILHFA